MPLGGIPLGEARTLLGNRLKQFYTFRDGQLSIRIQVARTINVNIFGEVERNGNFTMSSLNTGFNALVAAGGPTDRGSVRNIQLVVGEETTILDVYKYLNNPAQQSNLFVPNNATIFVPLAEKIISLSGGVRRPLQYELNDGETLVDLIAFAGGVLPRAETGDVRITRYQDGKLEVINVDLSAEPGFALRNGDEVNIPIIENPIEDFVTIEGAVLLPGRYAYEEGIKLADLVAKGRLRPGARKDVAFLFRTNDDGSDRLERVALGAAAGAENLVLQRGDLLRILSSENFIDRATFTVQGAVRNGVVELPFPTDGTLSLSEAILLAGGLAPNAAREAMLIRTPSDNQENKSYERLDLSESGDLPLRARDR
ncbi:MAG: SLBB domain-containing protein, partial [Bacteroidota bacterium]